MPRSRACQMRINTGHIARINVVLEPSMNASECASASNWSGDSPVDFVCSGGCGRGDDRQLDCDEQPTSRRIDGRNGSGMEANRALGDCQAQPSTILM